MLLSHGTWPQASTIPIYVYEAISCHIRLQLRHYRSLNSAAQKPRLRGRTRTYSHTRKSLLPIPLSFTYSSLAKSANRLWLSARPEKISPVKKLSPTLLATPPPTTSPNANGSVTLCTRAQCPNGLSASLSTHSRPSAP